MQLLNEHSLVFLKEGEEEGKQASEDLQFFAEVNVQLH
jgi:hypothetical protein